MAEGRKRLGFGGEIGRFKYLCLASLILVAQHAMVFAAYRSSGVGLVASAEFWMLPRGHLSDLFDLAPQTWALAFIFAVATGWALAALSFRRAVNASAGYLIAALTIIPVVQIGAVAILSILPRRSPGSAAPATSEMNVAHVLQGALSGVALIVLAVLVSALTFGAYGWGLFVATPFMVGVTTAYLANRDAPLSFRRTVQLVLGAGALGSAALIALALEGLACIVLAAPLAALAAILGGGLGRAIAFAIHGRGNPLPCIAALPLLFALEGAIPPQAPVSMSQSIDIAAPPSEVWAALISSEPISVSPGFVASAGLAYPLGAVIRGEGVGAERRGRFSTGIAHERIVAWEPGRLLSFEVVRQPPAMEEMSPYRRVHAPHVEGYFETRETSFALNRLTNGGTRLTATAEHILRIDPIFYWEPVARWAIQQNVGRVLQHVRNEAER